MPKSITRTKGPQHKMNTENLESLVEVAGKQAQTIILDLHQELMPTWVFIDRDGGANIVGTPWQDEVEKKYYGFRIKRMLAESGAIAYSFLCEAWASSAEKDWKPGQPHIEPRLDPDRREVVLAFATDGDQIVWRHWNIIRNSAGRVTALKKVDGMHSHLSWLTQLLPKKHA